MSDNDPTIIDAEFVDVAPPAAGPPPGPRPPQGYGRRTVARESSRVADLLDAASGTSAAVAGAARAVGATDVADRAERAARLTASAADVAHELPAAVEAVRRETAPLRGKLAGLWAKLKDDGVVGGRREPHEVAQAPKRPVASRKAKKETVE